MGYVRSTIGLVLFAGCFAVVATGQTITTESLLHDMTDLACMAEFPEPPYTCKPFRRYDRASKSPDEAKNWFANGDCNQYLRVDEVEIPVDPRVISGSIAKPDAGAKRKEWVMMDIDGPGAIVRMWSANPMGTL